MRILITGASSGIGRALAVAFAADGADLVLLGRDSSRLTETAQACRTAGAANVETYVSDVRDRGRMEQLLLEADQRGAIDLVVANAGVASGLSPGQIIESPEAVRALMAINVTGVFNTVEPLIPAMCNRRKGQIAIVGSMAGIRALPYSPSYCAAKASIHMWANSLRGALGPYGISISLIVPGFVKTPMQDQLKAWQPGRISDTEAARIVKRGLERRRGIIAFPYYIYYLMRLLTFLPAGIVDGFMRRIKVEVMETRERGESS